MDLRDDSREEASALFRAGGDALHKGNIDQAIALFQRSAELSPHYKTLLLLGESLVEKGDLLAAVVPLAAASALNRQCRAPLALGNLFIELRDPSQAQDCLRLARWYNPTYSPTQFDALQERIDTLRAEVEWWR